MNLKKILDSTSSDLDTLNDFINSFTFDTSELEDSSKFGVHVEEPGYSGYDCMLEFRFSSQDLEYTISDNKKFMSSCKQFLKQLTSLGYTLDTSFKNFDPECPLQINFPKSRNVEKKDYVTWFLYPDGSPGYTALEASSKPDAKKALEEYANAPYSKLHVFYLGPAFSGWHDEALQFAEDYTANN